MWRDIELGLAVIGAGSILASVGVAILIVRFAKEDPLDLPTWDGRERGRP